MDEDLRKALINCYSYLVENIQYDDLSDHLIQHVVIPKPTIEDINCLTDRRRKVRKLLDVLPRRHNSAFDTFLQCLQNTDQAHIAQKLIDKLLEIRSQQQSSLNENGFLPGPSISNHQHLSPPQSNLLQNQPSQSDPSSTGYGVVESNYETEIHTSIPCTEQDDPQFPEPQQSMDVEEPQQSMETDCYEMNSNPRGYILIINNEKFNPPLLDRSGSMKDASELQLLFWRLGFYCDIKHNLQAEQMKKCLSDFSQMKEHENLSCCAVVLMSHGAEDPEENVYGTCGQKVSVNDLLMYFNDQNCPNLMNKPKLFIIQACRNNNSTTAEATSSPLVTDNSSERPPLMKLVSIDLSQDAGKTGECRINSRADMLIAYATAHGNPSYRHKRTGSIFIQFIIEVFNNKAHNTSVTDMLIEVNGKLRERYPRHGQIGVPEVALTKKWFLKPIS